MLTNLIFMHSFFALVLLTLTSMPFNMLPSLHVDDLFPNYNYIPAPSKECNNKKVANVYTFNYEGKTLPSAVISRNLFDY